jgi:hypothetical protein
MLLGYDKYVTADAGTGLLGRYRSFALCTQMLLVFICGGSIAEAQQPSTSGPQPSTSSGPPPADSVQPKNDRIFGILPNYRTVENPNIRMAPLSAKGKFKLAIEDSFDPYAYVIAGSFAGYGQTKDDPKSWGEESWGPYIKRYAASFADQTSENIMTEAVVPWMLKEDPRYFRLGTGGFFKRTGYAVSRIWVTQTDAGHRTFNFSEIMGAGASAGISNFYYPREDRTMSANLSRWGVMVGEDTFFNLLKEYWPDIRLKMFKRKHSADPPF